MRCLDCKYDLNGLIDHQCPECGREFHPEVESTYDSRVRFDVFQYISPGIVISMIIGVLCFTGLSSLDSRGYAIWIGVPIAMGCGFSFYSKAKKVLVALFAIFSIGGVIFSLYALSYAGIFCALILFVLCMIPFGIGMLGGVWLRTVYKSQYRFFEDYLPALIFVCAPYALHFAGLSGTEYKTELAVSTSRVVIGTPEDAWDTLMFFEDVETDPPLLMKIAIPQPIYSSGEMSEVGDQRVCVYTKGNLGKEIVEVREYELLAFRVIEQGFEPSVVLTGGYFKLEEHEDGKTKITLSTRYIPVHSPRFAWRWAEIVGARTLHTHVINGIESQILRDSGILARNHEHKNE